MQAEAHAYSRSPVNSDSGSLDSVHIPEGELVVARLEIVRTLNQEGEGSTRVASDDDMRQIEILGMLKMAEHLTLHDTCCVDNDRP